MNYVWAVVINLVVLILAVGGIIAVHRWVSAKKNKITLDVIIALVMRVSGLSSQTFIGVLQVFPSSTARPTSANGLSAELRPTQYTGALF